MGQIQHLKLVAAGTGGTTSSNPVPIAQPAAAVAIQFNVEAVAGAAPASPSATAAQTGGTQPIATYFYEFSAISSAGLESAASTEVHSTITSSTGSTTLSWSTVTGSTLYRVYRGTSSAAENVYFTTTTGSFTDDGAQGAGTAGTPMSTTPTVTFKAQGSFDKSTYYDVPYVTEATATESQATATMTSAGSKIRFVALTPTRFFPYYRVVTTTSVASQLTYNADLYTLGL